jgi:hypothetical protein
MKLLAIVSVLLAKKFVSIPIPKIRYMMFVLVCLKNRLIVVFRCTKKKLNCRQDPYVSDPSEANVVLAW